MIPGTKGPEISTKRFQYSIDNPNLDLNIFNETPFQQLLPREQRYGGYVKLDYQPFEWLRFYEQFLGNHLEETNQAAPTAVGISDGIIIPRHSINPHNPFGDGAHAARLACP